MRDSTGLNRPRRGRWYFTRKKARPIKRSASARQRSVIRSPSCPSPACQSSNGSASVGPWDIPRHRPFTKETKMSIKSRVEDLESEGPQQPVVVFQDYGESQEQATAR